MTPAEVDAWNRRNPAGTPVDFFHEDGFRLATHTVGPAVWRANGAVVAIDGLGEVELSRCTGGAAPACDGATCACVRRFALRVCPSCLAAGCGEDSNATPCRLARWPAPTPVLAAPATIVLMQLAPGAWTVELTIAGVRRFASVGLRSRRVAMESVTEWLEMEGGPR